MQLTAKEVDLDVSRSSFPRDSPTTALLKLSVEPDDHLSTYILHYVCLELECTFIKLSRKRLFYIGPSMMQRNHNHDTRGIKRLQLTLTKSNQIQNPVHIGRPPWKRKKHQITQDKSKRTNRLPGRCAGFERKKCRVGGEGGGGGENGVWIYTEKKGKKQRETFGIFHGANITAA